MKASRLGLFFACIALIASTDDQGLSGAQAEHQMLRSNQRQNLTAENNSRAGLARANVAKLPLFFESNQGQTDARVRFLSRSSGYTLFLTSNEAVLRLRAREKENSNEAVLRMKLLGSNENAAARGLDELPGKANYFIGRDPAKWHTSVATYGKIKYEGIYPGVDLVYYGNQRQLEYDFVVSPGADPNAVFIQFDGAPVEIDSTGDLVLRIGGSEVRVRRPVAYQSAQDDARSGSTKRFIDSRFVLRRTNQVAFQVAPYDRSQPLVIDPVLVYSSYLGGSFEDQPLSVAVDSSGAAYITGITCSADFPVTTGAFQTTSHNGIGGNCPTSQNSLEDTFVTKFNPGGTGLVYSTYIGGTGSDRGYAIAIDSSGNAYIAGQTNSRIQCCGHRSRLFHLPRGRTGRQFQPWKPSIWGSHRFIGQGLHYWLD
jgi:hypothetical protein